MDIRPLLLSLGIRTTLKGFHYLRYGLELCMQNDEYLLLVYKWLFSDIAKHYHSSQNNVEHCIRTAVSYCWRKGNRRLLIQLAGHEIDRPPSNSEFINILYNHLMIQEERKAIL
ncbi:MAG: hypothetical protein HFH56_11895 [Lachnospiraceae bacterium]|jgi:Sporulation initiation factor Spo0A C terminal.|nr:hypothetical protein [Lachnospiraceae bacterium]MCI9471879.1 hypothetical protein [Lachnospiraceae bacterium]